VAAVSESTIQNLSTSAVARFVYDKDPENQLIRILPFFPIDGHELKLATVSAGSSLSAYAGIETEGGSLVSTVPSISNRTHVLSRISAILEVYTITQDKYNNANDVLEQLVDLKRRAVKAAFCTKLYTGDSATTGEFDGLNDLASTHSQEIGADGGAADGGTVAKGELELLRATVNVAEPGTEVVFVMHTKTYKHLLTTSYSDVEFVSHPVLGMVPSLAGTPIVFDNYISLTETRGASNDTTSIYCLALGRAGVSGIYPSSVRDAEIRVRGPITSQTTGLMTYHVSWDVGIGLWNAGGFARMYGVKYQNVT